MNILISIIIPHYNIPLLLKKSLNSIPKRADVEVILIDDKSDKYIDELNNVIDSFSHPNFIYLENTRSYKNAGTCRNIGINVAHGKWITFLDADDYFNNNFNSIIDDELDDAYDTIFFPPTSIEEDYSTLSDRHISYQKLLSKNNNDSDLRYKYSIPVGRLYKKSFLVENKIRFEEIIASNDIFFTTLVGYYMCNYKVSESVFYVILKRIGSLTQNVSREIFRSRLNAFLRKQEFLKKKLDKNTFKKVCSSGLGYFWLAIKSDLGFRELLYIYKLFYQYNVRIITLANLNPLKIYKLIQNNIKFTRDRKYKIDK